MAKRLAATFVALIFDAALKSFWRRKALSRFLRQAGIADSFVGTWTPDESKRDFLDRLFAQLPRVPQGENLLLRIARDLAQQESFPDLVGWEESARMCKDASASVLGLRRALARIDHEPQGEHERHQAQERFRAFQEEIRRSRQTLESLSSRLGSLATGLGSQQAGYAFQGWFYDLMDFSEIINRRPYVANGRQIDGSITVSGTTYLVELKFTRDQADSPDVDTMLKKVADKADNTMGIIVAISGYSSTAKAEASGPRTPLLLFDHRHLYLVLGGNASFGEVVDRVRRHASQTGESYLSPEDFNG
jgi:Restriction endonuclease